MNLTTLSLSKQDSTQPPPVHYDLSLQWTPVVWQWHLLHALVHICLAILIRLISTLKGVYVLFLFSYKWAPYISRIAHIFLFVTHLSHLTCPQAHLCCSMYQKFLPLCHSAVRSLKSSKSACASDSLFSFNNAEISSNEFWPCVFFSCSFLAERISLYATSNFVSMRAASLPASPSCQRSSRYFSFNSW